MPSLAGKVRTLAARAIKTLGDINTAIVYVKITPGVYNTTTGVQANTPVSLPMTVPVLTLDENERKEFPAPDQTRRVIIPWTELQAKGVEPDPTDYILIGGQQWEIKRFKVVPTAAITKLYIESP